MYLQKLRSSLPLAVGIVSASVYAQHATFEATQESYLSDSKENCFANVPGDIKDLLAEVKKLNALVSAGQISAQEAQTVFRQKLKKSVNNDPTAERLVLLLANEALSSTQQNESLSIIDALVQGKNLNERQKAHVDAFIPPSELPKIVDAARPHFAKIREAGIAVTGSGLDFSKADPKTLRSDTRLQQALDVLYPGSYEKLSSGKLAVIGNTYLLPPPRNSFKTQEQMNQESAQRLDWLQRDLMIYAQASIESTSYWDMMRGRLTDRAWWADPDAPTGAEIERDETYASLLTQLTDLRRFYGINPDDLKPYYLALAQIQKKESAALEKTLGNIQAAKRTFIAAPLALTGLGLLGRGSQISFLVGMGITSADIGISAGIDRAHFGGNYLCHLAKNGVEIAPTGFLLSALFAPLSALRPLHLTQATQAGAKVINATASKIPGVAPLALQGLSPAAANTAFRRGLYAMAVPGLSFSGIEARDAYRAHQAGKFAEKSGNTELAAQAYAERDHSIAQSSMGLALAGLPWLASKHHVKQSPSPKALPSTKAQTVQRFNALKGKRLKSSTYKNKQDVFLRDFDEFVRLRDRTRGVDSKEFLTWWKANHTRYTSDSYKKALGKSDHTFDELLELAAHDFYMEAGRVQGSAWREKFAWMYSPKAMLAAGGALAMGIGKKVVDASWNAVTLAPTMRLVNAYTDAPIVPLEAYLKQRGNKDLGNISKDLQGWINNGSVTKGHLAEMEAELLKFREATSKTPTDSGQARIWKDFQNYYYKKFQLFQQSLPSNLREGRSFMLGMELMDTASLGNMMGTRYESYLSAKRDLEDLEIRQNKGETLDPIEVTRMQDLRQDMERNLDGVAGILAIHKIRQFMYRSDLLDASSPTPSPAEIQLDGTFEKIAEVMGYRYFNEQVGSRMESIFANYKAIFQLSDQQTLNALQMADKAQN